MEIGEKTNVGNLKYCMSKTLPSVTVKNQRSLHNYILIIKNVV